MNNQKEIEKFISRCREVKLSVTPQRLSIFKALIQDSSHPSPESIYQSIKIEHPTISLATVYKTLDTFEKYEIISMVTPLYNTVRYDPMTKRHHHLVCVQCKRVIDLDHPQLDKIKIPAGINHQHQLIDYSIHFNIICSDCLQLKA